MLLFNNEKGIALIMALIMLVLVGGLTAAFMITNVFNLNQTASDLDRERAFYAAEAGINYLKAYVYDELKNRDIDEIDEIIMEINDISEQELDYNHDGIYKFELEVENNTSPYRIKSTGWANDDIQVALNITYRVSGENGNGIGEGAPPSFDDIQPISDEDDDVDRSSDSEFTDEDGNKTSYTYDNNDHIKSGNFSNENTVLFETDRNRGFISPSSGDSYLSAPKMSFQSDLKLTGNVKLSLESELVVFHEDISIEDSDKSKLCFNVYEDKDVGYIWFEKLEKYNWFNEIKEEDNLYINGENNENDIYRLYKFTEKVCLPDDFNKLEGVELSTGDGDIGDGFFDWGRSN